MEIELPTVSGPEKDTWELLFELHSTHPKGWVVVGARMVEVHAAYHRIPRPIPTRDTDILVDIRTMKISRLAGWFSKRGFELEGISPDGIGHRFVRHEIVIDLLSIDHSGGAANRTTIPPARTVEVPGGRTATARMVGVTLHVGGSSGRIHIPDWMGAVLLKARAATTATFEAEKHLRDLALLLGLPVDLPQYLEAVSKKERRYIRDVSDRLTPEIWQTVSRSVDPLRGRAALTALIRF